jgi:hypothetical protein
VERCTHPRASQRPSAAEAADLLQRWADAAASEDLLT